jgi:hypothetical protein
VVAAELGMRVERLEAIAFDAPPEGPIAMMSAARSSYSAPPQITREEVTVSARVTADLILAPR